MQVPNLGCSQAQHLINLGINPPEPLQFVLWEHIAPLVEYIQTIEKRVSQLERGLSEWVNQQEAMRITGITADTLKRERERLNTLIVVRFEGETDKKPMYLRSSLHAYCESKIRKPKQPGRDLAKVLADVPQIAKAPEIPSTSPLKRRANRSSQ